MENYAAEQFMTTKEQKLSLWNNSNLEIRNKKLVYGKIYD
jgi:hypothetical protein